MSVTFGCNEDELGYISCQFSVVQVDVCSTSGGAHEGGEPMDVGFMRLQLLVAALVFCTVRFIGVDLRLQVLPTSNCTIYCFSDGPIRYTNRLSVVHTSTS